MALSCPVRTSPFRISCCGCCACASSATATRIVSTAAASANSLPKSLLVMCPLISVSKQGALPHRRGQRSFIEIVELAADRHAVGEPCHLDPRFLQQVGNVMRGG